MMQTIYFSNGVNIFSLRCKNILTVLFLNIGQWRKGAIKTMLDMRYIHTTEGFLCAPTLFLMEHVAKASLYLRPIPMIAFFV